MRRLLLTAVLLLGTAAPGWAQLRFWANSVNGLWDDAAKWSPADTPDTVGESAIFDRFGTYRVSLPDTAPVTIDDLRVDRGDITFQSAGFGLASLAVGGDATLSGDLLFRGGAGSLAVDVGETLSVLPGSLVDVDGQSISAGAAEIEAGSNSAPTRVQLLNGASADFGSLDIASSGSSGPTTNRSSLDLYSGSVVSVGDLRIASRFSGVIGEVNLVGAELQQGPASQTMVGVPIPGAAGRGVLTVGGGGIADLGSLVINESGSVQNSGGAVSVTGSLRVSGEYKESGAATRDFSAVDSIQITDGGRVELVGAPLALADGARLEVFGGELVAPGLVVSGGADVLLADSGSIGGDIEIAPLGRFQVFGHPDARFSGDFTNRGDLVVTEDAKATFEGAYVGGGATGGGELVFLGELSPGMSPGAAVFDGDLTWGQDARYLAQLAGVADFDTVATTGTATLAGELAIELDGWTPAEGDAFTLLTAGSLVGSFDTVTTATLSDGLEWRLFQTGTTLTARVVTPGLSGDFNYDGRVDAADYSVWRDSFGVEGQLLAADANGDAVVDGLDRATWAAGYGSLAAATAVPEPAGVLLLMAPLVCGYLSRNELAQARQRP